MMNSVYSGCVTGMAFGIKQGPQAACAGCLGMAAFSAVMDAVMGHK
jgi:mitochondrial import inner membrane translocase subunit TIM22